MPSRQREVAHPESPAPTVFANHQHFRTSDTGAQQRWRLVGSVRAWCRATESCLGPDAGHAGRVVDRHGGSIADRGSSSSPISPVSSSAGRRYSSHSPGTSAGLHLQFVEGSDI
jgi:hypothetical protein